MGLFTIDAISKFDLINVWMGTYVLIIFTINSLLAERDLNIRFVLEKIVVVYLLASYNSFLVNFLALSYLTHSLHLKNSFNRKMLMSDFGLIIPLALLENDAYLNIETQYQGIIWVMAMVSLLFKYGLFDIKNINLIWGKFQGYKYTVLMFLRIVVYGIITYRLQGVLKLFPHLMDWTVLALSLFFIRKALFVIVETGKRKVKELYVSLGLSVFMTILLISSVENAVYYFVTVCLLYLMWNTIFPIVEKKGLYLHHREFTAYALLLIVIGAPLSPVFNVMNFLEIEVYQHYGIWGYLAFLITISGYTLIFLNTYNHLIFIRAENKEGLKDFRLSLAFYLQFIVLICLFSIGLPAVIGGESQYMLQKFINEGFRSTEVSFAAENAMMMVRIIVQSLVFVFIYKLTKMRGNRYLRFSIFNRFVKYRDYLSFKKVKPLTAKPEYSARKTYFMRRVTLSDMVSFESMDKGIVVSLAWVIAILIFILSWFK